MSCQQICASPLCSSEKGVSFNFHFITTVIFFFHHSFPVIVMFSLYSLWESSTPGRWACPLHWWGRMHLRWIKDHHEIKNMYISAPHLEWNWVVDVCTSSFVKLNARMVPVEDLCVNHKFECKSWNQNWKYKCHWHARCIFRSSSWAPPASPPASKLSFTKP